MGDRDILPVPMRGAIHAHQKYTAALGRDRDNWMDAALHRFHKSSALLKFVSIIQLVSPNGLMIGSSEQFWCVSLAGWQANENNAMHLLDQGNVFNFKKSIKLMLPEYFYTNMDSLDDGVRQDMQFV